MTDDPRMAASHHYDVIVLGVGSMGAAACWNLAARGKRVLGLEQFDIPHDKGSHAGQSRIIRNAYFEHPDYVPLLKRAYKSWRSFQKQTDSHFYHQTGILYFGQSGNENIRGIRHSAQIHHIPIENWSREKYKEQYGHFKLPGDFDVIYESDAGFVTPEQAISMYVEEARKMGADIRTGARVISWKKYGDNLRVMTQDEYFTCEKLVITAGPWAAQMIPQLKAELVVTRQFLAWVQPRDPADFQMGKFPCWFVEDPALGSFYGFPVLPEKDFSGPIGLKLAHHHPGPPSAPGEPATRMPAEDEQYIRRFLRTYLPDVGEEIVAFKSCLYTYSPDTHFIIDHLPGFHRRVAIACGFSGHGFKFVPVVGEILADLALEGETDLPIGFLGLDRF